MCHSGSGAPLGLQLDSYEGALAGSQNGPVLVSGDPNASELVRRIRGESQPRMPLVGEPLATSDIEMIERWIRGGLAGPDAPAGETASERPASPETQSVDDGTSRAENGTVTFADVEPIFLQRYVMCHSDAAAPRKPPEGLRLDTCENILAGGELPRRKEARRAQKVNRSRGEAPCLLAAATDAACEGDRLWFGENPDRRFRLRPLVPKETPG